MNSKPWIIAHRGSSGEFPENTIIAFLDAIESRADIIEMDLQLTDDDQVVIFHDREVNRIFQETTGKEIKDFTLYDLKQKEVGSWFDPEFRGLKIPSIVEVLESLPKDTSLILELKNKERKLVESVFQTLDITNKSLGLGYISVKDEETYKLCKEISSKHKIGLMQKKRTPIETIKIALEDEIEIIQIRWEKWKGEDWKLLDDLELIVTACCADKEEEYQFLVEKKVNGILTNYPKQLFDFLNKSR